MSAARNENVTHTTGTQNHLLLRALRGETTPRPPIWLMRQAGRTDPLYRELKQAAGLPLEGLFRHPELAARISLLPRRLGIDAIIYFQDILTALAPMGAEFVFAPGPILQKPVENAEDLDRIALYDVETELPFIPEVFERIHKELSGALPVLGFAGAPLTLAVFLLEGKSFGETAPRAMTFIREHPRAVHSLLDRLTEMTIAYLRLQAKSGAAALQLFESAAFLLQPNHYREFALPYQQRVFAALRGMAPTILFARNWTRVDDLGAAGADVLSLPAPLSIQEVRERLGANQLVQGNLSNQLLRDGGRAAIKAAAHACIEAGACRGHIFNLDHGLLRDTPFEHVQYLVDVVRNWPQEPTHSPAP